MAGTSQQWKRTLRRACGVPDIVSDEVAIDAIAMLFVKNSPWTESTIDHRSLVKLIIEVVLDLAEQSEIDRWLLPESLREPPEIGTGPDSTVYLEINAERSQYTSRQGEGPGHARGTLPALCRRAALGKERAGDLASTCGMCVP